MSSKVFVGNISFDTTRGDLVKLFTLVGRVCEVVLIQNGRPGHPSGFAFVTMSSSAEAHVVVDRYDGRSLRGCFLKVTEAQSQPRSHHVAGLP